MDSTISRLLKYEISRFYPASVIVQFGLCQTWSETQKTGFSRVAAQCAEVQVFDFYKIDVIIENFIEKIFNGLEHILTHPAYRSQW